MQQRFGRDATDGGVATCSEATLEEASIGVLRYAGRSWILTGRALRLVLWLAGCQQCINTVAPERGQLWLTWKGGGPNSIDGEVKTRLSGE